MEERYENRRRELEEALRGAKKEGLRAFLGKPGDPSGTPYVLLSDGTDILYIEHIGPSTDRTPLFSVSYEYMPSREAGSACAVTKPGYGYEMLNRKAFCECTAKGRQLAASYHAKRYKGLDQFLARNAWKKEHYEEL